MEDGYKKCDCCGESFPACDMIETVDDMAQHGWLCDKCYNFDDTPEEYTGRA